MTFLWSFITLSNLRRFFLISKLRVSTFSCALTIDLFNNSNDGDRLSLLICGDVHPNPGPMTRPFELCHWHLNSILSRDSVKISLIQAYNSAVNFDLIALSETYFNKSIHRNLHLWIYTEQDRIGVYMLRCKVKKNIKLNSSFWTWLNPPPQRITELGGLGSYLPDTIQRKVKTQEI